MWGVTELSSGGSATDADPQRGHDDAVNAALIMIDVQAELFSGYLPIGFPPRESSLDMRTTAMGGATAASVPVVVVRHTGGPGEQSFQQDNAGLIRTPDERAL